MAETPYVDNSYPPVGTQLRYHRGDGVQVTISIGDGPANTRGTTAPVPAATPPAMVWDPRPLLNLFGSPGPLVKPQVLPPAPTPPGFSGIQTTIHLEGRPEAPPYIPRLAPDTVQNSALFEHPIIGGKFTVFSLLYGGSEYHQLHRRCIDSIVSTCPRNRLDLRIGSNALCPESLAYVEQLVTAGIISRHYRHTNNDKKYPVMREMFWDSQNPINTKWLIWFDDDTIADRNSEWLGLLAKSIIDNYPHNYHMYGARYIWPLQPGQAEWVKSRPWYKGKQFRLANGKPAPNGNNMLFATGGFWALSVEAMRKCDMPDPALQHNGGDSLLGEMLYQNGFLLKAFNGDKKIINTSSVKRRGLSEPVPGTRQWHEMVKR